MNTIERLDDLKNKQGLMIELRTGEKKILIDDRLYDMSAPAFSPFPDNIMLSYNQDFSYIDRQNEELDIVRIFGPSSTGNIFDGPETREVLYDHNSARYIVLYAHKRNISASSVFSTKDDAYQTMLGSLAKVIDTSVENVENLFTDKDGQIGESNEIAYDNFDIKGCLGQNFAHIDKNSENYDWKIEKLTIRA